METKGFYQFEIIINVIVRSSRLIWIPKLCLNIFTLSVQGSTLDFRIWRLWTSDSNVWSQSPRWKDYSNVYDCTSCTTVVSIVGSLRDREVACSASDRRGSNFESCVWRTVSSQSSHHPQEVLLAQFSLYVHKGSLKPDSFHFLFLHHGIFHLFLKKKHKWFITHTNASIAVCPNWGRTLAMFNQCWYNVRPASKTIGQHCTNIGSTFSVC